MNKKRVVYNKENNILFSTINNAIGTIKDTYKNILRNSDDYKIKIYAMENTLLSLMNEKQKREYLLKRKLYIAFSKKEEKEENIENLVVETYMSISNKKTRGPLPQVGSKNVVKGHKRTVSSIY